MSEYNRYQAPQSKVDAASIEEFAEMKLFGASGRIGRVRYIAYGVGVNLLLMLVIGMIVGIMQAGLGKGVTLIAGVLLFAAYVFMIVYSFMLAIRRSHDFNVTGWMSLLVLVPLVNLMFLFVPGTQGANDYGAPPPPNSTGNVILALIMPVIAIIGILAAIAIPAYQGYVKQAHKLQQQEIQQQR